MNNTQTKKPPRLLRAFLSTENEATRNYKVNYWTPVVRRLDGDAADAVPPTSGALSPSEEQQLLLAVYAEVMASWRDLHEVRFRLLGLLPLVTLAVFAIGGSGEQSIVRAVISLVITLLGLAVTVALYVYDSRNSELYDGLISRGRRIEAELGVGTGVFLGRENPTWDMISHGTATDIIYGSVTLSWIAGIVIALVYLID